MQKEFSNHPEFPKLGSDLMTIERVKLGFGIFILLIASLTQNCALAGSNWSVARNNIDQILLILPDGTADSDPRVSVWIDAGREEGLHLRTMRDSEFISLGANATRYVGVIVPDQVHMIASDALVSALRNYVAGGGKLMLVYDAGVLTSGGFYPSPKSRFSDMVGVDYALYDSLRDMTIGFGHVTGMRNTLRALGTPPGKSMLYPVAVIPSNSAQYVPPTNADPSGLLPVYKEPRRVKDRHQASRDDDDDSHLALRRMFGPKNSKSKFALPQTPDELHGVSGYFYGFLGYPSFVTQGVFGGAALLTSPDHGLVAGVSNYGTGKVLFVNTPLGYLKGYGTDGLLLHGFLRHFADSMLRQPILASVPNGTGGLVLNVHTDSALALPSLNSLNNLGIWDNGPFSIHFTAGPDTIDFGDGIGLNVPGNPITQSWIRVLQKKGHQIGSHGGWIHDWFAANLTEFNQADMLQYLVLNKNALEAVTKKPMIEYSAPQGNMPKWIVDWAEGQGMLGYYFVGNTGMSPTRSYRENALQNQKIWSFPITPYGKAATFEEFEELGISGEEATRWFSELTDFSIQRRTARLIYFHPPGAELYNSSVTALMQRTKWHQKMGHFNWYTMADLAKFLSAREQVSWQVSKLADGKIGIEASHVSSLKNQAWILPKATYGKPYVVEINGYPASNYSSRDSDDDDERHDEDEDGKYKKSSSSSSGNGISVTEDNQAKTWVVTVLATKSPIKSVKFAMQPVPAR